VLENDVLRTHLSGYQSSDLDQLCTMSEVVWIGAGSVGVGDGRVRLMYRDQVGLLAPVANDDDLPAEPIHDALRAHLDGRGASFWSDLVGAAQEAELPYGDETVLAALWDLVWAGEVTNDSLVPLHALVSGGSGKKTAKLPARGGRRLRARPGGLSANGPPTAAGRWSLVAPLRQPVAAPTEAAYAKAHQLLDRYGVLTRETALSEGVVGGFAGVYPVLKALEERGEVRRGYFVAGLGAAQFALPGAVDRLRAVRDLESDEPPLVLAATDPAQPCGAVLAWPDTTGAHVVLIDGIPAVELERGGRSLITFPVALDTDAWIDAIQRLVKDGRLRKLEIGKVDGQPVRETPWAARLKAGGFAPGYRGMTFRG
jgi:ATP-dependent Lhr-like helicase